MPIFFDMVKCELKLKGVANEVTRISMLSKVVVVYRTADHAWPNDGGLTVVCV